jgi:glycosyltransferase involved in cell wall biosynthesis
MAPLNDLHLITDTDRRGAQTFAVDLAETLHGCSSSVLALAPGEQANPLPVATLGPRRLHPATLHNVRRRMAASDVVVAHGSSTLIACSVAGTGLGTPFVYRQISDQLFWATTPFRRARVRAYLSRAAHAVALWPGSAQTLIDRFGVADDKVTVIPNGVPSRRFPPPTAEQRRRARTRFGVPADGMVLLCIGALVPEKGVDLAIGAMAHLPEARLLVVGDGPEASALRVAAGHVAPGRILFSPPMADPLPAYAAADVVALPSRGGDSMPAVLIEAGMQGLPAVACPVEGIVDIVADGITGRLVREATPESIAQAVSTAYRDRARLGPAARQRCLERYSLDAVAARWEVLLRAVSRRP